MRRSLFALTALCALAACEPSVDDYVEDAKAREEKLRECADMGVMAAREDNHCQMAMEAQGMVLKSKAGELIDAITLQESREEN